MKTLPIILAAMWLAASTMRAQLVADGATNTLSDVTTNITGTVTVGTNGSFTLLVLSDNVLVTNTTRGIIGLNATAMSNEVQVVSPTARWQMGGVLSVGSNGPFSRLVVSGGGQVADFGAIVGRRAAASNCTALVTDSGSLWSHGDGFIIGQASVRNQLVVSNGATVAAPYSYLGDSGSDNQAVVTGIGSQWTNATDFHLGITGAGNQLTVENGGRLSDGTAILGLSSSAANNEATVTGVGSLWSNRLDLVVGQDGSGNELIVSNGAAVYAGRDAVLGVNPSATANAATIIGAGTQWLIGTNIFVGSNSPLNRLVISDGAFVSNRVTTIGYTVNADTNEVQVTGAGTVWSNASSLTVGFNGSSNRLTISDGAVVSSFQGSVGASLGGSNNSVFISGPGSAWTNRTGFVLGVNGAFSRLIVTNGGWLHSTNGVLGGFDTATNNEVIITGAGSTWNNVREFTIGQLARANRVTIENGGLLTASDTVVGNLVSGSNNLAVVSGAGSLLTTLKNLTVGQISSGNQLIVSNGGWVMGSNTFLGFDAASRSNRVTLTDPGSYWTNQNRMRVGEAGSSNLLVVSNGAVLGGTDGSLGETAASSNNTAIVTGANSAWTNLYNFRVGTFGSGNRLVVENGGRIAHDAAFVGVIGSRNEARLSGAGTLWTSAAELVIGDQSTNNLLVVSNGAVVLADNGTVGNFFNASNNAAVVTGAGSTWSNATTLCVGAFGARNQLVVTNGGMVFAGENVFLGESIITGSNRIVVTGGTLRTTNASGTASLDIRRGTNVFNAGLMDVDQLRLTNTQGFFEFNGGTLITRGASINNFATFMVGRSGSTPAIWDVRAGPTDHVLADNLHVGNNSSFNQLLITNGASLFSDHDDSIGVNSGANSNSVLVSGSGSLWSSRSHYVGIQSAFNRLVISNGGAVISGINGGGLGGNNGGRSNLVVVTGSGSIWSSSGDLLVGGDEGNQLIVSDGGAAASVVGFIGYDARASNCTALITGPGSTWSNSTTLVVGMFGARSQLIVSNGAAVFAAGSLVVGTNSTSTNNRIVVDNATLQVTNSAATGLLEIRRGTNVLNAGVIEADILRMTNGTLSKFEFNGGTLAIKSSRLIIGPPLIIGNGISPATLNLAGNGTHDMSGTLGLIISSNATLTGNGSLLVQLQVRPGAQLVPGTSVGKISLSTPPFFSGAIAMELSKNGANLTNDQIQVTGTVTYGGALTVTHLGPTPLAGGDKFQLFNATAYAGAFAALTLPPLAPGLSWINNLLVDGSIEVFASPPVGAGFALGFDGTNDFVIVSHDSRLNGYPLTATAWIKTTQATGEAGIINKYLAGSFNGWQIGLLNGEVRAWYLRDNANRVGNEGGGLNGGAVSNGAWHHVAFTVDATSGRLYVDGYLRDELDWTGTAGACTTTQAMHFGRYPGGGGEFFKGELEEAAIWGFVALTPGEIKNNLDRGLIGSESGLVSYHRFNEGTGDSADNAAQPTGTSTRGYFQNGVTWVPGLSLRPAILTRVATAVAADSATLHGVGNPGLNHTTAWFEWGTTTNYGTTTAFQTLGSGGGNTNFSQSITGLTKNVTYHFRAVASNSIGASFGNDKSFVATGTNLLSPRMRHTATLLPNGKVLVVGGRGQDQDALANAELFDPASGTWAFTGPMSIPRYNHTATVLPTGKVLVVGGQGPAFALPHASAELYDPATGTWTPTGSLQTNRHSHTATLLADGQLLVAGGASGFSLNTSAEIYDPATGNWTATGALLTSRTHHTASLLPDGKVLLAGGRDAGNNTVSSAEHYDPVSATWTSTGSMTTNRYGHTATLLRNGKVLVVAGRGLVNFLNSAELYDPIAGTWAATGAMLNYRFQHTATLLPDGKVFASGEGIGAPSVYNPLTETWADVPGPDPNSGATATLLLNGNVLVAGGVGGFVTDGDPTAEAELYLTPKNESWTVTAPMASARGGHTATLLSNALVLVACLGSSEIYNPTTGVWTNSGALVAGRTNHTATLLPNGKVLVVGGVNSGSFFPPIGVELYDATSGTWTNTGALVTNRTVGHTATLLPNGKVLVAGGYAGLFVPPHQAAELYDPATGSWTNTGATTTNRHEHTATMLPNGKVLVTGGIVSGSLFAPVTSAAELYDPVAGTWTAVAPMTANRRRHISVLLPNGKVLVAGGFASTDIIPTINFSAELFDPATGTWQVTGSMTSSRRDARATLLPNGKVLVTGGRGPGNLSSAEFYDPGTGTWTATLFMGAARSLHTSTMLPNGRLLVTGGFSGSGITNRAELYDIGLLTSPSWQPQILTATLSVGGSLALTGTQFRGLSGGSGGNGGQDSPTDYPIVQLRRLDNDQTGFIFSTDWSSNSFASVPVLDFQPGWAMATVYVSGIPSDAKLLNITAATPAAFSLTGMTVGLNGDFQFSFTNVPGALFTVLATTNASQPLTNWTVLGNATEVSPGQYQFSDPQATNNAQRYYRALFP